MRILLAKTMNSGLGHPCGLAQHGFQVDWVRESAVAAERELATGATRPQCSDLSLPARTAWMVLRRTRARRNTTPVLELTRPRRRARPHRRAGRGADITSSNPSTCSRLAPALRALVRRAHGQSDTCLAAGDVVLDPLHTRCWPQGQPGGTLQPQDTDLLHALMLNAGRVLDAANSRSNDLYE